MQLTQLFTEDRGVSPVIGVILMVAITVILAAVIGTFVLNLGSSIQQTAPQASMEFSYNQSANPANGTGNVTIVHSTGDSLTASQVSIADSNDASNLENATADDGTYSAGDVVADGPYDSGETIRVVWQSANGENSATISQSTAP